MKWENLSKLMAMIDEDTKRVGYLEMTMQKGKNAKIEV